MHTIMYILHKDYFGHETNDHYYQTKDSHYVVKYKYEHVVLFCNGACCE
jgi:hypothetical protein